MAAIMDWKLQTKESIIVWLVEGFAVKECGDLVKGMNIRNLWNEASRAIYIFV